jgi:lipooligosaccharide transport system ATP-binding protein
MVIDHGRTVAEGAPRELIRREIEPAVVEVFAESSEAPAVREWAGQHAHLADRIEIVGETAFFYCRDANPLQAVLAQAPGLAYVHRAANLEDVFLKLTGRELRD